MLKGIDVSKWQGDITWSSVAKNRDFAIIRSSYGTGYTDEKFAVNRDKARQTGILHGFYHYSYPNHNTPEAEADWFLSVVMPLEQGELLCLDFEENYPDPVGWSKRFLDRISERLNGYRPLIYINKYLTSTHDWSKVANAGYGLWLAYWDYDPNGAFEVPYWDVVAMRQYSNQGSVNGISGRVDENVFYGDKTQFAAYGVSLGDLPCEKIKEENELLKSEKAYLEEQNLGLQNSLNGLNELYKKLLADDEIEDAEMAQLLKDYNALTELYKNQSTALFNLDKRNQELTAENKELLAENSRLKQQKFTVTESIVFLIRAIKGGGNA